MEEASAVIELTPSAASQSVAFANKLVTLLRAHDSADTEEPIPPRKFLFEIPIIDLDVTLRICLGQLGEYGCCHLVGALSSVCRSTRKTGGTDEATLPVIAALAEEILRYLKTRMAREDPAWHEEELTKYFLNILEEELKEPPLLKLDSETKKRIMDDAAALRGSLEAKT